MPQHYSAQDVQLQMDKLAIKEVLDRYFFGEGRLDVETMLSCFTPDAAFGGAVGHDAIRALMVQIRYFQRVYALSGAPKITIDGDTARVDMQAVGILVRTDGGADTCRGRVMVQGVHYDDHLVRTADGWKIKKRVGLNTPSSGHDTHWQFDAASVPIHLD
jgi:hypothetical protein